MKTMFTIIGGKKWIKRTRTMNFSFLKIEDQVMFHDYSFGVVKAGTITKNQKQWQEVILFPIFEPGIKMDNYEALAIVLDVNGWVKK